MNTAVKRILSKAVDGHRLSVDEGVQLFDCRDIHALGRAADSVCRRLHPEPYRTYNIDRNINYTNVCAAVCDFCAFYRKSNDADAYVFHKIARVICLWRSIIQRRSNGESVGMIQNLIMCTHLLEIDLYSTSRTFVREPEPERLGRGLPCPGGV